MYLTRIRRTTTTSPFFLKFVLFVASMGIRYSAPGPTAVGRVYWRRTVTATPGKLAQGVPREGPGDGTQTGRAQRGTPTARRHRNRQRQTTGLRQGAASCGIADPNQVARATSLDCLPRTRTDFGFGSRGAPACSRPVTHTCLPRLLWTGRACRRQFAQGAYHGSVRSRCTARRGP